MADTALWRKEPMIVLLTIGRAKPFDEIVRRKTFATLHTAEAFWMPDSVK